MTYQLSSVSFMLVKSSRKISFSSMESIPRMSLLLLCVALKSLAGRLYRIPLSSSPVLILDAVQEKSASTASDISIGQQEDDLKGKPGQGYYTEMAIGTPPQKVRN